MKRITVGFSTDSDSKTSRLIRWWMGTSFSHTYLYFKIEGFRDETVFQAVGSGLELISLNKFLSENKVIAEFQMTIPDDVYNDILNKCHQAAGDDYAFWQNVGDVLAQIFHLKKNPFTKGHNCSEWIAECIIVIDPEAFSEFEDLNLVRPNHVFDYLEKNYGKTKQD